MRHTQEILVQVNLFPPKRTILAYIQQCNTFEMMQKNVYNYLTYIKCILSE